MSCSAPKGCVLEAWTEEAAELGLIDYVVFDERVLCSPPTALQGVPRKTRDGTQPLQSRDQGSQHHLGRWSPAGSGLWASSVCRLAGIEGLTHEEGSKQPHGPENRVRWAPVPGTCPTRLPTSKIATDSPNPEPVVTAQGLRTAETSPSGSHDSGSPLHGEA